MTFPKSSPFLSPQATRPTSAGSTILSRKILWIFLMAAGAARVAAAPEPITAKDFTCQGQAGRSATYEGRIYEDCSGGHLPSGGIDARLLDLLNRLQADLGRKVVVASGYRCQAHNLYSWGALAAETGDEK